MKDGGIYVDYNDEIWICLMEKELYMNNNNYYHYLYRLKLDKIFENPNNLVVNEFIRNTIKTENPYPNFHFIKDNLCQYKSTDVLVNGGYLGQINEDLLKLLIKYLFVKNRIKK